jgi:HlyD family secretion protein
MSRKAKIAIGIVVVVAIAGIIAASIKKKDRGLKQVTTGVVEKSDLVSKVSANGRIEAKRKVDISANVMGQIVNLAVREGDRVERGDFLMQIDRVQLAASAASAEASLNALAADREAAKASLENASRNYERAKLNFESGIIPKADLDAAETQFHSATAAQNAAAKRVDSATASLAGARDNLSKTTITAPMSGLVTALPVEEGEVAVIGTMNNPGTNLMTISDMSVVEAVMEVDETDIPNVSVGQKARVVIDAYPDRMFDGTVTEVGSSPMTQSITGAASQAVNFEVKIQLDDPSDDIRPGFSCSGDIITGTAADVVAIPIQALVLREKEVEVKEGEKRDPLARPDEEEGVYVFDETAQTVKFTAVETGITGDLSIEIKSGLEPGAKIVTGPFRMLREIKDGDKVKPEEKGGKKGEGPGEEQES